MSRLPSTESSQAIPTHAVFCLPPGHDVVVMVSGSLWSCALVGSKASSTTVCIIPIKLITEALNDVQCMHTDQILRSQIVAESALYAQPCPLSRRKHRVHDDCRCAVFQPRRHTVFSCVICRVHQRWPEVSVVKTNCGELQKRKTCFPLYSINIVFNHICYHYFI